MSFRESLLSKPKPLIVLCALVALAIVGVADYNTKWEVSFFAFYSVPLLLVGWTCSRSTAVLFTLLAAVLSWAVNLAQAPSMPIHSWRSLNRLMAFSFVAIAGQALRAQREQFKAQLAAMQQMRELEQEIIRVSEREQRRIGQDLHDGVCQSLAAIDCAAGLLKGRLESCVPAEAQATGEIQHLLRETLREARSLARGIFPVQVEKEGLAVAIEELAATANRIQAVPVKAEVEGETALESPETAMHLYRIAQEALSNALRHSGTSSVQISLRRADGQLTLKVEDEGSGIREDESDGMGFRTMRYRAQVLGAGLTISSTPGRGTRVACTLSLPTHASQH